MHLEIGSLSGKILSDIQIDNNQIVFTLTEGTQYKLFHKQIDNEYVRITSIKGNVRDLIGTPIVKAGEVTNSEDTFDKVQKTDCFTWTFYNVATSKGTVIITWLGEGNTYSSQNIDFVQVEQNKVAYEQAMPSFLVY